MTIDGGRYQLDKDRSVFVGSCAGRTEVFIEFINKTRRTRIQLSPDALGALLRLAPETSVIPVIPVLTSTRESIPLVEEEFHWAVVPADEPPEGEI